MTVKIGSEKNFGIVFGVVFVIVALYPITKGENIHLWLIVLSIAFFCFSFFYPKVFRIPNQLWFKLGLLLNRVFSPVILGLIFYLVVFGTGLFFRLFGFDPLNQKQKRKDTTYWSVSEDVTISLDDQF